MTRSWCVPAAAGVALLAAGCAVSTRPIAPPAAARTAPAYLRVRVAENGTASIRRVRLEDYVQDAILSEFAPADGDPGIVRRMLEIQAVISRTYALANAGRHASEGYDLCSTTHCQLYERARVRTSKWAAAARGASDATRGTVLWYGRAPASAVYHSDCGGRTSAPASVWGGTSFPYLTAAADDGPAAEAHTTWRYEIGREALRKALGADTRTGVGGRLDDVVILERDEAGRVVRLRVKGERDRDLSGVVFRDVVTRAIGVRTIRSTMFDVQRQGAALVFDGRGFGHGVGLCQAGALARIKAGAEPSSVLARYFPGTRLVRVR